MISRDTFGTLPNGDVVDRFTLLGSGGFQVQVINYGGIITSIKAPDRAGRIEDVTLGYDDITGYLENPGPHFGALVGRVANRIRNGRFQLDGVEQQLETNEEINDKKNTLHGGTANWSKVLWKAAISNNSLILKHTSRHLDGGFPGEVVVKVTFEVAESSLSIDYEATTDRPTVIDLTSHPYFNLAGHGSNNFYSHYISINADKFLLLDDSFVPTGEIRNLESTPFDLRSCTKMEDVVKASKLLPNQIMTNTFCLCNHPGWKLAADVLHQESGRRLTVYTDQPGLIFYTGDYLNQHNAKGGAHYHKHAGFCLEAQGFPNAVNDDSFPSPILRPDSSYKQLTTYAFSVLEGDT